MASPTSTSTSGPGSFASVCVLLAALGAAPAADTGQPSHDAVLNARVVLHWLPGGKGAWYRRQSAPGRSEYVLIDALSGKRQPLFDHARLATQLQAALGGDIDARSLPITALDVLDQGATLWIKAGGRYWQGSMPEPTLAVTGRKPTLACDDVPRPSRSGGGASTLTLTNRGRVPFSLFWLDFNGARVPFGAVAPQQERELHTYGGHVWLAECRGRICGVVEAGEDDCFADIFAVDPPENDPPPPDPDCASPDGKWLILRRAGNLWLRRTDVEGAQVRVLTGKDDEVPLTSDGSPADAYGPPYRWSPDSTHLVAMRVLAGERRTITLREAAPADGVQPKERSITYPKPGDRIDTARPCLFAVEGLRQVRIVTALLDGPWSIDHLAWNPDGQAFTMLYNQRGHEFMRVVEIDRAGTARAVITEKAATFIDYAGKSFYHPLPRRREILWMSERDGWNHLYRYDAVTGQVKNQITRGAWAVRSVERVDETAGLIWFTAGGLVPGEDPYQRHLARVAFDGSGLTVLTAGDGDHVVTWSPDRRWFVDTWSRVDAPPQSVLRDGATGRQVMPLEQADITGLRALGWQSPERFAAKARDGVTDVYGVLWRPRGFSADKRYPVVECIYAGPQAAYVPKAFQVTYGQQAIADLGFVVGMVDCMGTSYRSKAFHDVCWKNLADAGFPDRIPWWKAAAATRPWLDLSRVGIYGGSAGGQNALGALLWHPEFYQVAVADCGCHDNRVDKMWWNELWMGWPVGPHYAAQSNVVNAARLQGRLMLIVGEIDDNVDPACTYQVAHALEQAGKDFELVVVQGAGHGAAETPFGSRKRADFLVRELLGSKR